MAIPVIMDTRGGDRVNLDMGDAMTSPREPARTSSKQMMAARAYLSVWPTVRGRVRPLSWVHAAAGRADVALRTILLCDRLRREHREAPVWLRTKGVPTLLIIHRDDLGEVLYQTPEPFTGDTAVKHAGMSRYQAGALAVCRGRQWRAVRDMVEAVLTEAAGDRRHAAAAREHAAAYIAAERTVIDFPSWLATHRALARRIVLGERAAADEAITDLLAHLASGAHRVTGRPDPSVPAFASMIDVFLRAPEPGTVAAGLVAHASPRTPAAPQIAHLLSELGDTLALNTFRTLQLLSARPAVCTGPIYTTAALQEAARLWPSTPVLARESTRDTRWGGEIVPAGTRFLIVNTFGHRDRRRVDYADDFLPSEWLEGGRAQRELLFNGFGHGPQDCPGEELALSCGSALLSAVAENVTLRPVRAALRTDGRVAYSPPPLAPIGFVR